VSLSRRSLLAGLSATAAFSGLARAEAAESYVNQVTGYGPLVRDPARVLDLPEGFSYRILSRTGDRMSDGLRVPGKFDGMGAFDLGGGRTALVRNHEIKAGDTAVTAFVGGVPAGLDLSGAYARGADGNPLGGGTTTLVLGADGRVEQQYLSLAGTAVNCAGGITPWGSWLSCEETTAKNHGYVFEVPAAHGRLVEARPLPALGRFKHEAACIDPRTGIVYLTEDTKESLLYRCLPAQPGALHKGGRLQALAVDGMGDSRNWKGRAWSAGDWKTARWIDLDGADNPHNDIAQRGHAAGATYFARGEGIFWGQGELYFACTSGGPTELGQIVRYVPAEHEGQSDETGARVQLFVEPSDRRVMDYGDNLAMGPGGHLVVCEDNYSGAQPNHLKGVTPDGRIYTIGRNVMAGNSELAGVCFSPDGRTMFVNVQTPGTTFAITGPWERFAA
jgi:secreted PhoX family phosphatase